MIAERPHAEISGVVLLQRVRMLGLLSLLATLVLTVLSPLLAGFTYYKFFFAPAAERRFDGPAVCGWCAALASDANPFRRIEWYVPATALPLLIASLAFLGLLFCLKRHSEALTDETASVIQKWSIYFGLAGTLAIPIFVGDFWLSAAWGRMAANGVNPYYSDIPPPFLRDIPIYVAEQRMTYGPLWALIAAAVGFLSQGSVWIMFLLFKIVLTGSWIGSLHHLRALMARQSVFARCVGMALFGWLPLGFLQATEEGHNDVVMVFFLLWGLRALEEKRRISPILFTASALVKYVTGPFLALDALHALLEGRMRRYLLPAAAAALGGVCVFAVFFRSPAFFDSVSEMRSWRFMEPSTALNILAPVLGPGLIQLFSRAVRAGWVVLALYYLVKYYRQRTPAALNRAVLGLLAAILFTGVGHVWPWFMIWVLAGAAVATETLLARWIAGVALLFPFVQIWWRTGPKDNDLLYVWPAAIIYIAALVWLRAGPLVREEDAAPFDTPPRTVL